MQSGSKNRSIYFTRTTIRAFNFGLPKELELLQRCYAVANITQKYFLGLDWVEKNVADAKNLTGYLAQTPERWNNLDNLNLHMHRAVDFSEMLLNLQFVPGFHSRLAQLKTGNIETTRAELETAFLLYSGGADLKFIVPIGKKGYDYDLEFRDRNGLWISADTKCKVDDIVCTEKTVANILTGARSQLPSDRSSVIFLRVPSDWLPETEFVTGMSNGIRKFLLTTGRIAAVVVHSRKLIRPENGYYYVHIVKSYVNERCRNPLPPTWSPFSTTPKRRLKVLSEILSSNDPDLYSIIVRDNLLRRFSETLSGSKREAV